MCGRLKFIPEREKGGFYGPRNEMGNRVDVVLNKFKWGAVATVNGDRFSSFGIYGRFKVMDLISSLRPDLVY